MITLFCATDSYITILTVENINKKNLNVNVYQYMFDIVILIYYFSKTINYEINLIIQYFYFKQFVKLNKKKTKYFY